MKKRSTSSIREGGQQNIVKTGSGLKPEIVSSVIQKWHYLIDVTTKIADVPSGFLLKLNENSIEVLVKSNTEGNSYEACEDAKLIYRLYSETVIGTQKQLLVPDITKNKVWKETNPNVDVSMVSYLGLPINWPDGEVFGTVCLLDKKENCYNQNYIDLLNLVKIQIETDLQLLVTNREIADQHSQLKETVKSSGTDKSFHTIFENSLAVMLLIDPETHQIAAANKAAEKFYGWKRIEIETMHIDDINTLSSAEIKTEMEKARKSERIYLRYKHRRAFGDIRDVEVYSGKVEIDGKEYLHSIIHDISEHKRVESELRQSEQRFRMMFESANVGKSITRPSGEIEVNQAFCDMLGYSREKLQNKKWQEITPPEEVIEIEKRIRPIMEGQTDSTRIEKRYIHKNGSHVWADVSIRLIRDSENKPLYFITTVTDISKQKLAEEELRQSEERFKALHNASFGGIVIHDKGNLVDFNHGLSELTGYTQEELAGMNVLDLIAPANREFINEKLLSRAEKPYEAVALHKTGKEFPVRIETRDIPYKEKIVSVVEFRDISEQNKAVEQQAKSLNLLNSLAKQVPGVVYQYRLYPDGRSAFPYSSPGMWDIYEVTPEEVQEDASPIFTRIHPDDYEYIVETITESAKNQTNYESEFRVILPKQGLRWRHSNAKPELLEDGSTLWHGIITDVTEQKRAVEEQTHLLDIIERSQNEIYVFDEHILNFVFVNQGAIENLGYSKKEMKSMTPLDIKPEFTEETFGEMIKPLKDGLKERLVFETLHQRKNGTTYPAEIYLQLQKSGDKNVFLAVINDITERKKIEKARRQSDERFRIAQDMSPDGFTILRPVRDAQDRVIDFTWIYENESIARLNGTDPKKVVGQRLLNLFPGQRDTQFIKAYIQVAESGETLTFEEGYSGETMKENSWFRIVVVPMEENIAILAQDITERKKAEEELLASEQRFRAMVEGAPDPIFIQTDYRFSYLNKPALQLLGANSEAELLGKPVMDVFHHDFHKTIKKRIVQLNEKKQGVRQLAELKFITLQGEEVWVETSGEPILYHGKHGGLVFVRDITDRKKSEEALSHSHELMKYIIDHNQSSVAVLDKNLKYLFISQRYLRDYRVKEKNIIGKHHYEVFPDMPEKWKKVHQKALKGTALWADEDVFYRKDGTFDWTRWECRPWYEADGSIGGIILYLEVISEQKRKEEEIKKLNERLEILVDSVQRLATAQSLEAVQEMVTQSARKLIGADGATLVFRENGNCFYVNEDAIQPLWKGKKFPMHSCISGWVMQNKQAVVIEDIFVDNRIPKDVYSPTFVKSLAMVPVIVKEPIGAIGNYWKEKYKPTETELKLLQTLADATARAIENINLYAEMEERVKQRTEQLQSVNKELETFTYSVSHDLKAPLRGIDGYSKLLLDEYGNSLNEEAAHFIQTIRSSTLQMNQLLDDLLSYSRLERSQFKIEKISLKSFVKNLVAGFNNDLKKPGISIKNNLPNIQILADSTGLSIALRNFIENAIKFSDEQRSPLIQIGFDENPEAWIIHVKDNGVGFDMKYHNRIFEIFQRLHRAEDFPGTGIGLAMVVKALQRMGGKAWAKSKPGEGATFFIEIPKNKSI